MVHNLSLDASRVVLRPLTEDDTERMRLLRNRYKERFLTAREITQDMQRNWFEEYLHRPGDYMFSVFRSDTGAWIGAAALYGVDTEKGEGEFGRLMIDREAAGGGGFGREVTEAVCALGFDRLGLERIRLEVYADNAPAVRTYEKAGFHLIGESRAENGKTLLRMERLRKEKAMEPIQVLKPKFHIDECLAAVRECLEKGWTGMGFKTVQLEEEWKKYTGHPYAYYLNSNTVGLHLAVKILKMKNNWQDGDEVISTPITFVSTNHAILYENMHVTFADVDEYLCLDPEDVERKITDRTRAVIFVGYGGRVGRLQQIIQICRRHGLKLILDAAHMSGTRYDGVFPGTWEGVDVTVYSFQAVKNLPTGDSGMICWSTPEEDALTRQLAWMGINKDTYARANKGTYAWKYDVDYVGYKYNGNAIMAAIALVQLRYLDEDNRRRRQIAAMYDEGFGGNPKISIIPANHPEECSYHLYELAVPDREGLLDALSAQGINCGVHYRDNTEYSMYLYANGTCPRAHEISQHLITMPLHMWLTDEDVERVIRAVNDFVK